MSAGAPSPTEQAVVQEALKRGFLRREQLREAQQMQRYLEQAGRPTPLLTLLRARYLRAEHVEALKGIFPQAGSAAEGGRAPPSSGRLSAVGASASDRHTPTFALEPNRLRTEVVAGSDVAETQAPAAASASGAYPVATDLVAAARASVRRAYQEARRLDPHVAAHADDVLERLETLGEGGMGVVYRVRDLRLGREAALKLIRPGREGEEAVRRFRREVEITAKLDHPSIPPVYEAGTNVAGHHFMLMRVVEGQPLSERIKALHRDKARSLEDGEQRELLEALVKVSEAVAYANSQKVIHRDLKPDNVMVGQFGEVMVVDWGLARDTSPGVEGEELLRQSQEEVSHAWPGEPELTQAGAVMGTPGYMAPEQAEGRSVDARADVFALGAILTCVLTGRPPIEGATAVNKIAATLRGKITLPRARRKDVPRELNSIAARALAKAARDRYRTAEAFASDLRAYLAGEEVSVHSYGLRERFLRRLRRHVTLLVGLVAGTLALAGLGLAVAAQERAARAEADTARAEAVTQAKEEQRRQAEVQAAKQRQRAQRITDADRAKELERQASKDLWPASTAELEPLRAWLEEAGEVCRRLAEHRAALADLSAQANDPGQSEQARIVAKEEVRRLEQLVPLLEGLGDTEPKPERVSLGGVQARIERAKRRRRESVLVHEASWSRTRASLANRRDCPRYSGLRLEPVEGLVPLGRDSSSGLWEFWHMPSGARPRQDASGRWSLAEGSGLVLVLIPGGTFRMGSPAGGQSDERPVHAVSLGAFFLSKYEMTQDQWRRVRGENPSGHRPGERPGNQEITPLHPVEQVSWEDCVAALSSQGLSLPSEAQWEYAARAGAASTWWTGDDVRSLQGAGNIADRFYRLNGGASGAVCTEEINDGRVVHAPAGSYRANAFGLHDVIGNVWEWVQDSYHEGYQGAPRDGFAWEAAGESRRVTRGGSWGYGASFGRSAFRNWDSSVGRSDGLGLRPAISIGR